MVVLRPMVVTRDVEKSTCSSLAAIRAALTLSFLFSGDLDLPVPVRNPSKNLKKTQTTQTLKSKGPHDHSNHHTQPSPPPCPSKNSICSMENGLLNPNPGMSTDFCLIHEKHPILTPILTPSYCSSSKSERRVEAVESLIRVLVRAKNLVVRRSFCFFTRVARGGVAAFVGGCLSGRRDIEMDWSEGF